MVALVSDIRSYLLLTNSQTLASPPEQGLCPQKITAALLRVSEKTPVTWIHFQANLPNFMALESGFFFPLHFLEKIAHGSLPDRAPHAIHSGWPTSDGEVPVDIQRNLSRISRTSEVLVVFAG